MEESAAKPVARVTRDGGSLRIWAPFLVIVSIAIALASYYTYRYLAAPVPAPLAPRRDLAQEARADLERRDFRPLSGPLETLLNDPKYVPLPTQAYTLLLQPAPEFALRDVNGKEWTLAQTLKDGPVVLVFYYGYHCDHCVSQLFALNKDVEKFRELGVQVVAISADAPELTRERFKQYGAFHFPVLSDPGNKVAEKYETFTPSPKVGQEGDLLHGTFLIARTGKIVWANRGDVPFTENRTLLHEAARLEGRLPGKTQYKGK